MKSVASTRLSTAAAVDLRPRFLPLTEPRTSSSCSLIIPIILFFRRFIMATPTPKTVSPQQYRQLGIAAVTLVSSSYALYRFVYPLPTLRSSSKRLFHPATAISEDNVSLDHLLAAFGADGRNAKGTAPGCMVASPSKEGDGDSNNYWFQWPRDTGLCVRSLVEALKQAETGRNLGYSGEEIERRIRDFVLMSIKLQHLPNPSGTFETGGLGEPKFEVSW